MIYKKSLIYVFTALVLLMTSVVFSVAQNPGDGMMGPGMMGPGMMGQGMMGSPYGWCGPGMMGPGMMGPGMMGPGMMGPGMMGPGMMQPGMMWHYHGMQPPSQKTLDEKDAKTILENYLQSTKNPNLKLGKIKDAGSAFEAEIVTKENSLVDKVIVDKTTGLMKSAY